MPSTDIVRDRVGQVFRYLEALNQLRHPVVREVERHPWTLWMKALPDHEAIELERPRGNGDAEAASFQLTVGRAELHDPPSPPAELQPWLEAGWKNPGQAATVRKARNVHQEDGTTVTVRFEDDDDRSRLWQQWNEKRDLWAEAERPARDARALFERVYALYSDLERQGERLELVLGDGILNWRVADGGVHHPVLIQRLRLRFDPEIPQFTISETDHEPELYSALFRALPDVDAGAIAKRMDELSKASFHPLGEDTAGFFSALVNPLGGGQGEYVGEHVMESQESRPRLGRDPVLFVRSRTGRYTSAIERILERIPEDSEIPVALTDIVEPGRSATQRAEQRKATGLSPDKVDVLLSKAANAEQVQIAERLERTGAVIVQGPPGTGKTHTIANLLGHLLAQGKSVLVTSHTEKALQRVRDQVVAPLRPLCVSVLTSNASDRDTLQDAIGAISDKLGSDPETLERKAETLNRRRQQQLDQQRALEDQLLQARREEYEPIVIGGESFAPSDAARHVDKHADEADWLPAPAASGAPPPLSDQEVQHLYRLNASLSPEARRELRGQLPDPGELQRPAEFSASLEEIEALRTTTTERPVAFWTRSHAPAELAQLRQLAHDVEEATSILAGPSWILEALEAGRDGDAGRDLWMELAERIRETDSQAATVQKALITHEPSLASNIRLQEQVHILSDIAAHLARGQRLGFFALLRHSDWKALLEEVCVHGRRPEHQEEFEALLAAAQLEIARRELRQWWERMVAERGGLSTDALSERPERKLRPYAVQIERYVTWFEEEWQALAKRFENVGLDWQALLDLEWNTLSQRASAEADEYAALRSMGRAAQRLQAAVEERARAVRLEDLQGQITDLLRSLQRATAAATGSIVEELVDAVHERSPERYATAYKRLSELNARREEHRVWHELLEKVRVVAPSWATAVEAREEPHHTTQPPGDASSAWRWRQLHDALEARARVDVRELQRQLGQTQDELKRTTAQLIELRAWAYQIRRVETNPRQRQALHGWALAMNKIGAGTGKRVAILRREAQKLMRQCREAVPVWVMPLAGLVENFDAATTRFDVVIIDEASQLDVMGLIALYMAREVVIVGDDKQVSPSAVGQRIEDTNDLIANFLQGVPLADLYDGKTSVYDLAASSFERPILLKEHFRCVPDIIAFSNAISYDFQIKPLRDASQVSLQPHVVPHRVSDARYERKTNEVEALEIASLLTAAIEHPAYQDVTFGVVTLVGDRQAELIDTYLRSHLSPLEYDQRRVRCGNPATFQGDERDVMFISVVDAPGDGPLPLRRSKLFQQRFNVAASRARNQMWVVHSLDPEVDLKPEDLRKRLIDHAYDPRALAEMAQQGAAKTDSVFEKLVLERLVAQGYKVVPQWEVGAYRIDLVVVGPDGEKLAVECDGDRFHPPEQLADDMERQAILERLGWRFVRIRGSIFFRDPDRAMAPVFERLRELQITPAALEEARAYDETGRGATVEEVVRRAAELRRAWNRDSMEPPETNEDEANGMKVISSVAPDAPSNNPSLFDTPARKRS